MNVCQNVAYWQEIGELSAERNHPGLSQIFCSCLLLPSGAVLGRGDMLSLMSRRCA